MHYKKYNCISIMTHAYNTKFYDHKNAYTYALDTNS